MRSWRRMTSATVYLSGTDTFHQCLESGFVGSARSKGKISTEDCKKKNLVLPKLKSELLRLSKFLFSLNGCIKTSVKKNLTNPRC